MKSTSMAAKIADFYHIIYMAFGRKTDFYFFCSLFL